MKKNKNISVQFEDRETLVLTSEGVWLADGEEITHEPTRQLFLKSLVRDDHGYQIRIGRESKRVLVQDTPYFITRIEGTPASGVILTLSCELKIPLHPHTLTYQPSRLTCQIQDPNHPDSLAEAKFLRQAYFDLLQYIKSDAQSYYLEFGEKEPLTRIFLSPL